MIIEDKKQKEELDKIPDTDQNGEPIFKIDADENQNEKTPVFLQDEPDTPQGNTQDIKDSTEE